nr:MAG TPA: hypothetical protein [Caudoviricetes sp.]
MRCNTATVTCKCLNLPDMVFNISKEDSRWLQ